LYNEHVYSITQMHHTTQCYLITIIYIKKNIRLFHMPCDISKFFCSNSNNEMSDWNYGLKFQTGIMVWNVRLVSWFEMSDCYHGLKCQTGIMVWNVRLVLWFKMSDWYYGLKCQTGIMVWNVRLLSWFEMSDWNHGLKCQTGIMV
jgi:hypothetical protein